MRKSPMKVRISFEGEALTHFGGVYLLAGFIRQLRLRRLLHDAVRFRRWNTGYATSEEVLSLLYPILLGLGRVETPRVLQQNGAFQYITSFVVRGQSVELGIDKDRALPATYAQEQACPK